ncbi:MAG: zinc-dependent alcohol dehydrogenase family protein [Myxococcaceae bacterium]
MHIVQFDRFGEPADVLSLVDVEVPAPAAGEVRVRLTARAIHPSDLQNVRGRYGRPPALPSTPGNDAAGVVEALGPGVSTPPLGTRVTLLLGALGGKGTWREQVCVPVQAVVPTPAALNDAQAGALWVNYLSIVAMVDDVLHLQAGDVLIQTAAGSHLGRAMAEFAGVRGIVLVNVVRRAEQAEELRRSGAPHVVVVPGEDLAAAVRALTGGKGATAAIDSVGGDTGTTVLAALQSGGTSLLFGALDGRPVVVEPGPFLFRELVLQGFWLTRWLQRVPPERVRAAVKAVVAGAERGDFRPAVDSTYPLSEVRAAVVRAETPGRTGAVVLV